MRVFLRRLAAGVAAWTVVMAVVRPSAALELAWEGDVGTGWNDGVVGSDTNWTDGTTTPPGDQRKPTAGDLLVFNSSGIYPAGTATPLTLGGTIDAYGIMVGNGADHLGQIDFGVTDRILASGGVIRLGAGGLTASMLSDGDSTPNEARRVWFSSDIELTADTFIRRAGNYGAGSRNRRLVIDGVISGGTTADPVNLVVNNAGTGSPNRAVQFTSSNTFVGELTIHGTLVLGKADGFGDPSNLVRFGTSPYLIVSETGNVTTANPFVLSSSSTVIINRDTGTDWTLTGDITGGGSARTLDLISSGRRIIFAGSEQSFANMVDLRAGTRVVIAAADQNGIAWPNAGRIRINSTTSSNTMGHVLLQGDFTLNQRIEVRDTTATAQVRLGQLNDGATPFHAVFNGEIDVQEPDFLVLQLTADAGGTATFGGPIRIAGGNFGLTKLNAGTVAVNHRVSQGFSSLDPIGQVAVQQGTLLVNSPAADPFATTGMVVSAGAALGGSGSILGDVALTGTSAATLLPGSDTGPLVVGGDVDFGDHGVLAAAFGSNGDNRLEVGGLLDLSGTNNQLVVTGWFPGDVGLIASYGSLEGTFNVVDLSALGPRFSLVYNYQGQNQIAIIPEPATVLLLFLGALALLPRRSRRKRWL